MNLHISTASPDDAAIVATLAMALTAEIVARCDGKATLHSDVALSTGLCAEWIGAGHYTALIAHADGLPIGLATIAHSYALYAGGQIGIIQEFYVAPDHRSRRVGKALMDAALAYAAARGWACMELCTPPLPEFEQTITFYQRHGFLPVGGRKMRRQGLLAHADPIAA